jgi:hypothetical protein
MSVLLHLWPIYPSGEGAVAYNVKGPRGGLEMAEKSLPLSRIDVRSSRPYPVTLMIELPLLILLVAVLILWVMSAEVKE